MRRRGELVERGFAHCLETGGMRRVWLRGRANILKRYLVHVAAFNLGIVMREILGAGTPKGVAAMNGVLLAVFGYIRMLVGRLDPFLPRIAGVKGIIRRSWQVGLITNPPAVEAPSSTGC
jgi:hypothetical protein